MTLERYLGDAVIYIIIATIRNGIIETFQLIKRFMF